MLRNFVRLFSATALWALVCAQAFAAMSPPVANDDIIDENTSLPMAFRDELPVPTGIIEGNEFYGATRLTDGRYVVIWVPAGSATGPFYFRLFSPSGRPLTEVRTANQASDGARVLYPTIAALADGGFAVAWLSDFYARYRIYDADGNPTGLSQPFLQVTNPSGEYHMIGLANGSFLFFWQSSVGDGVVIQSQQIGRDGNLIGGLNTVAGSALEVTGLRYVFPTPNGGYVAIWERYPAPVTGERPVTRVTFQAYSGINQTIGSAFTIWPDGEYHQQYPTGGATPDGHFMIAFRQLQQGPDVFAAQVFGPDAEPVSDRFMIDTEDEHGIAANVAIGGRPDNLFRVTLAARPTNYFDQPGLIQLYDRTGLAIGDRFQADADARERERRFRDIPTRGDRFSLIYSRPSQFIPIPRRNDIIIRAFAHPSLFDEALNPIDLLANDSAPGGDALAITAINGNPIGNGQSVTLASGARLSLANGVLFHDSRGVTAFDSASRREWRSESFEYTITVGGETATANATLFLEGINDPPQAVTDRYDVDESTNTGLLTIDVLANDQDVDIADQGRLTLTSVANNDTGGVAVLSGDALQIEYRPLGRYEALASGQWATDRFDYVITDPAGLTDTGRINIRIIGRNDPPVFLPETLHVSTLAGEMDLSDRILPFASDIDNGDSVLLAGVSACAGGTTGQFRFEAGRVLYNTDGAFGTIGDGETADDCIAVSVSDSQGETVSGEIPLKVGGSATVRLTLNPAGLGAGQVSGNGLDCPGPTGCVVDLPVNTAIALTATAGAQSQFSGWGGPCTGTGPNCQFRLLADTVVAASFDHLAPPQTNVFGAILPTARTGEHAGAPVTALMSVLAGGPAAAQNCRIQLLQDIPFDLSYRRLEGASPVGPDSPVFNLAPREVASFVLAFQPTGDPAEVSQTVYPSVTCDNGSMRSTDGVNSIRLYTEREVWMDLLAIAATASQDGVLRINSPGGAGFMSASFINIPARPIDGPSPRVMISADTGEVDLPVDLTWCITDSAGICTTERTNQPISHFTANNLAHFVAVFARAHPDQGIPFDPANARVYLRFVGVLANIERAVTSVAITAPEPTGATTAQIAGSWSLLRPRTENGWPGFERIRLDLQPSGDGLLVTDDTEQPVRLTGLRLADNRQDWLFELDGMTGVITRDGRIRIGNPDVIGGGSWGIRMTDPHNREGRHGHQVQ